VKKGAKNLNKRYPAEFGRSIQNTKKIVKKSNQSIRTKNILKKRMLSTSKVKRSQKFVWWLLNGIASSTQTLKNFLERQIYQSKRKFSQKKYALNFKSGKKPKISDGICRLDPKSKKK
jgi:ribosomal protein S17E